ncbi:MAG: hypothetical protein K2P09_07710 [Erysipelotrichales bacterium]|nr:hypothetical protein [Erysipelotrichales bacterium]
MINSTVDYKFISKRMKEKRKELNMTQEPLTNELNMTIFISLRLKMENLVQA